MLKRILAGMVVAAVTVSAAGAGSFEDGLDRSMAAAIHKCGLARLVSDRMEDLGDERDSIRGLRR
jgi:hypothetical protein